MKWDFMIRGRMHICRSRIQSFYLPVFVLLCIQHALPAFPSTRLRSHAALLYPTSYNLLDRRTELLRMKRNTPVSFSFTSSNSIIAAIP